MREFCISQGNVSLANTSSGETLIWVNPAGAPNPNIEFLRYWVGFTANTTSAQQRIQIATQVTSFPTLTTFTPNKLKPSDPNASIITGNTSGAAGQCGVNASAEGGGAKTSVLDDAFNVLNGWLSVPTPPETRIMPAGLTSGQSLFFPAVPSTTTGWAYGLHYREV